MTRKGVESSSRCSWENVSRDAAMLSLRSSRTTHAGLKQHERSMGATFLRPCCVVLFPAQCRPWWFSVACPVHRSQSSTLQFGEVVVSALPVTCPDDGYRESARLDSAEDAVCAVALMVIRSPVIALRCSTMIVPWQIVKRSFVMPSGWFLQNRLPAASIAEHSCWV